MSAGILFEVVLIIALLVINGLLAMAEMAVVTARRARLTKLAEAGDRRAAAAIELVTKPTQFLSTVQIGITLIGILAGAYGGATIAGQLASPLAMTPVIGPYAEQIALAVVVTTITYLSLIVGELVPKRIALANPERIARLVAQPMRMLSRVSGPVVRLLTASTNFVLRLVGLHQTAEVSVTEDDVRALVAQGTAMGNIHAGEEEIVRRVLRLGDRPAAAIMTPRTDLQWIDPDEDPSAIRQLVIESRHTRLLVCQGAVDNVLGLVLTRDLLRQYVQGQRFDIRAALKQPLFIAETTPVLRLLEMFRQSGTPAAVLLDEFGGVQGMTTIADIFTDLVGELPEGDPAKNGEPEIVKRQEGGWLVDGATPVEALEEALEFTLPPEEHEREYRTVGGLVLTHLGHLPRIGEAVEAAGFRFEVVDMDSRRIDRVLITLVPTRGAEPPPPAA